MLLPPLLSTYPLPPLPVHLSLSTPPRPPTSLDLARHLTRHRSSADGARRYCVQFHDAATESDAASKVGKNPDDAEMNFSVDERRGILMMQNAGIASGDQVPSVNDNEKLKTTQYREMLYGICRAQALGARGPRRPPDASA